MDIRGAEGNGLVARDGARYQVPAVARALGILELLAGNNESLGVSTISRRLGIPKSTCLTILTTLAASGYVRHGDDQSWSLTPRLYYLGMQSARNVNVVARARPLLERLRDETGLTTHLGIPDGDSIVYALKAEPPGIVRFDTYPGKQASFHLTAVGRAVAAQLDDATLAAYLTGYRFDGGTDRAIGSRQAFLRELEQIRARGYTFENQEETTGVCCVAAPVFGPDGVAAAIGATGLSSQINETSIDTLSAAVVRTAGELTNLLSEGAT